MNGGIDYTIDLSLFPPPLAEHISSIQRGPDSPTSLISSARYISENSASFPETLPVLVDMLGYNNPVAASIAVDTLVQAGSPSVPFLLQGVGAFNYAVNGYALRALARIGDPSCMHVAMSAAKDAPIPGVRRAAVKALGMLKYEGDELEIWNMLVDMVQNENDWGVRYASVVAVEGFDRWDRLPEDARRKGVQIIAQVSREDPDPTVMARAVVALEELTSKMVATVDV